MKRLSAAMAFIAICGCKPTAETIADQAPSAPPPVIARTAPKSFTPKDWLTAYESTFTTKDVRADGSDGVTDYSACFVPDSSRKNGCGVFAFGRTDAFQKVRLLTPASSQLNDIANLNTFVKIVVVSADCEGPQIVLAPRYNSKNGWMFMEKAAVMADGELALEHSFKSYDVSTNTESGWISEKAGWDASEEDIVGLRKIAAAKTTIGRITGSKGYVTIQGQLQDGFVADAKTALVIYDALNAAFQKAGGPNCTTSKQ